MSADQPGLDERTAAFVAAAFNLANAMMHGEELRNRALIFGHVSLVTSSLLQTTQYPRDQELIVGLARLNLRLTEALDHIVLNAEPDDQRLQALQELAKEQPAWPTLVRPSDENFTTSKLAKLSVGTEALIGSLPQNAKRPPSLATARNRLALRLVRRIANRAEGVLLVRRNGGIAVKCSAREARDHLRVAEPAIPEKEHTRVLKLLRVARDCPFSAKNRQTWNRLLTEFVLIIDPKLEQFPELKRVKSAKGAISIKTDEAKFRSELEKFFHPALKNLLR